MAPSDPQPQQPLRGRFSKPTSSSPQWQMFIYLHSYYFSVFVVAEIVIFTWKGLVLPYTVDILVTEIILLFLISVLEVGRFFWGMKGNLTERRLPCFLSVAMCAPSIVGALYFLLWQTYILRLEAILIIVHMVFVTLETILGIVTISAIQKSLTQLNQ